MEFYTALCSLQSGCSETFQLLFQFTAYMRPLCLHCPQACWWNLTHLSKDKTTMCIYFYIPFPHKGMCAISLEK